MPIDKQSKVSTNKPITPALSSRFRSTKTPVAPKLAGSSPASPATTVRKDSKEPTLSPLAQRSQAPPLLNGNVTPRSGARTTRISTESPVSPQSGRRGSGGASIQTVLSSSRQIPNSTSPNPTSNRLTTKASSPNISATRRTSGSSNISTKDEEPGKFIRANDAKPSRAFQSPKSTLSPRPLSTSFLRNGSPRATYSAPPSAVDTKNVTKDTSFVRANAAHIRNTQTPTVTRKPSITSMVSMNTGRTRSPELSRTQSYPPPRPQPAPQASPTKGANTVGQPPRSPPRRIPFQSSPAISSPSSPSDRRRSFGSNASNAEPVRPPLHKKSASISSFSPLSKFITSPLVKNDHQTESTWIPPTVMITMQQHHHLIPSPDTLSPRSTSLASSKTVGTSVTSDTDISELSKTGLSYSGVAKIDSLAQQSQQQPSPLAQAQLNAANARRERKVLDLEISNSSLLAINKTLEKELRKQSAELRRFRRLSRSGRISIAPSNRSASIQSATSLDTLAEQTDEDEDDEDYSEEEDEESEIDEADEPQHHLNDSPGGTSLRARRRARDERRLMLDLSKHQQLLVDSQKLTQTIRKCLNMSEDLIKEGNNALKYKVGIGDIKLGGRVLSAEDSDHENDADDFEMVQEAPRKALLSPSITDTELQEARIWLSDVRGQDVIVDHRTMEYRDPG